MWIHDGRKLEKHVRIMIQAVRMVASSVGRLRKGTEGMVVGNARKMCIASGSATMDYGSRV